MSFPWPDVCDEKLCLQRHSKSNKGFFECSRRRCATDELDELWRVEHGIIREGYVQGVELRGIDAGHEVLQVFADAFE